MTTVTQDPRLYPFFANPVYGVGQDANASTTSSGTWDWLKPISSAVADIAKIAAQRIAFGEPDSVTRLPTGASMPIYTIGGQQYGWDAQSGRLLAIGAGGSQTLVASSGGMPSWLMPVAIIGGLALVAFVLMRRR